MALFLALTIGCKNDTPAVKTTATSQPSQSEATTAIQSLDIFFGGPFVFVQEADSVTVWIPSVKGHSDPFGVSSDFDTRPFGKGSYDFTTGVRPATMPSKVINPVKLGSVLSLSKSLDNLSGRPAKQPYMTIKLPIPREIVTWNADPITVSGAPSGSTSASTPRLSTLLILRFEFKQGDSPVLTLNGKQAWKPKPLKLGSENVLLVSVTPKHANTDEEQHQHARKAFLEVSKMIGISRSIDFPTDPYTRNEPLDGDPLPTGLNDILVGDSSIFSMAAKDSHIRPTDRDMLNHINDCKAPAVLLTK